jgi:hypothetical protein
VNFRYQPDLSLEGHRPFPFWNSSPLRPPLLPPNFTRNHSSFVYFHTRSVTTAKRASNRSQFLSHSSLRRAARKLQFFAIFCSLQKLICRLFKQIHALCAKHPGGGYSTPRILTSTSRLCERGFHRYLLSFHIFCRPLNLSPVFSHLSAKHPGGGVCLPA